MNTDSGAFIFTASESDAGQRLDSVIASHLIQCSRTQAAGLIRGGFIRLGNQVVKPAHRVRSGEEIQGRVPPPESSDIIPEPIELDTLYKDDHFIVLNKPAGRVVHPAPGHETGTLVHGLLYHFPGLFSVGGRIRPGIVHRLDKDTSGCLVVALNDRAHQEISGLFKARDVYKEYLALVHGAVTGNTGMIYRPIGRHPVDRKKNDRQWPTRPHRPNQLAGCSSFSVGNAHQALPENRPDSSDPGPFKLPGPSGGR